MSALCGIRIVELAESVAAEYCGKPLSDFGADVIKIERRGRGSPTRAMAPLVGEGSGTERSGLFAYLNTNKKSVVLDVAHDHDTLDALIATAHAVIDDHASPTDLPSRHCDVVFCSITPFGKGTRNSCRTPHLDVGSPRCSARRGRRSRHVPLR